MSHTAIVENKRLGHAFAIVKAQQDLRLAIKVMTNSEKTGYKKRGPRLCEARSRRILRQLAELTFTPAPPDSIRRVPQEIEELTVRAFIQKSKQDRVCSLLAHPKCRRDFTRELAHFKWLEHRYAHAIPSNVAHTAADISKLLRGEGAGDNVWIISENPVIDRTELRLEDAVERVLGKGIGAILSCIPGKLAFFQEEEIRNERLLEKP